jgi:aryl-alcohol dehydrogenase-like predicted oxidoreductase
VKYRQLGTTDLTVSEVAFGVWTVATGWWGKVEQPDAIRLLQDAENQGVTLYDTADSYAEGYGEELLRDAFPKQKRQDVIIGTKFGYDLKSPRWGHHKERRQRWDPEFIREACEDSLRRLGTDYIDLYQLHNPRIETVQDDAVFDTLDALVKEGKLRNYGVALGPDIGWRAEGEASMAERKVPSVQIIYSIIEQQPARDFFPFAHDNNTGLLARVPHASEILTDEFTNQVKVEFEATDHRAHRKQEWLDTAFEKRSRVMFIAQETGRTLAQAAIQFCLSEPNIAAVLPNIVRKDQLDEFTGGSDAPPLAADEIAELHRLYDEVFATLEEIQPQRTT